MTDTVFLDEMFVRAHPDRSDLLDIDGVACAILTRPEDRAEWVLCSSLIPADGGPLT